MIRLFKYLTVFRDIVLCKAFAHIVILPLASQRNVEIYSLQINGSIVSRTRQTLKQQMFDRGEMRHA